MVGSSGRLEFGITSVVSNTRLDTVLELIIDIVDVSMMLLLEVTGLTVVRFIGTVCVELRKGFTISGDKRPPRAKPRWIDCM